MGVGYVQKLQSQAAVSRAIHLGGADTFVDTLPNGLRTKLDSSGFDAVAPAYPGTPGCGMSSRQHHGLSGGEVCYTVLTHHNKCLADLILRQWQRIAISRAFMRADRPEVDLLLFDEPVSDTPQLYICRHESASLTGLGRHHHWTHMHRIKFSIPYIVSQGPHQATRQKLSSSLPTDFPPRVVPIRSR